MSKSYLKLANSSILLDKEGFLASLDDWSEQAAERIADLEGITLTPEHWEILYLVRDFYQEFDVSPAMRPLVKYVSNKLGSLKGRSIYLLKLFPKSPAKIASKIAGLPKPSNCL